jgi:hypothetical protein
MVQQTGGFFLEKAAGGITLRRLVFPSQLHVKWAFFMVNLKWNKCIPLPYSVVPKN